MSISQESWRAAPLPLACVSVVANAIFPTAPTLLPGTFSLACLLMHEPGCEALAGFLGQAKGVSVVDFIIIIKQTELSRPTTRTTVTYTTALVPSTKSGAMPKSFGERAGDMLVGVALTASLGAVALLLRKRKEKGQVRRGAGWGRGWRDWRTHPQPVRLWRATRRRRVGGGWVGGEGVCVCALDGA